MTLAAIAAITFTGCSGNGKNGNQDSADCKETSRTEKALQSEEKKANYEITDGGILSTNGLPVLVAFSADWCPPCQQLKPIFQSLKNEFAGKVDFITINVDSMPDLARKYKVENIPALIFISRDGEEMYRTIGYQEQSTIKSDIEKYLN